MRRWLVLLAMLLATGQAAFAAGRLEIAGAWIRTAPPGAMMFAGYATLRNVGDAPLNVTGASSAAFGDVSLHESISVDGVERMRPLGDIDIAPGGSVTLAPGGKHLMLMQSIGAIKAGESIKIHFATKSGDGADAAFVVRDAAP
jgi:copper(I)-binding protein